jgi:hypothetical protein
MLTRLVVTVGALFLLAACVSAIIDRLLSDHPVSRAVNAVKDEVVG